MTFNLKADLLAEIDKRFGKSEKCKVPAMATILDPRFKKMLGICTDPRYFELFMSGSKYQHSNLFELVRTCSNLFEAGSNSRIVRTVRTVRTFRNVRTVQIVPTIHAVRNNKIADYD